MPTSPTSVLASIPLRQGMKVHELCLNYAIELIEVALSKISLHLQLDEHAVHILNGRMVCTLCFQGELSIEVRNSLAVLYGESGWNFVRIYNSDEQEMKTWTIELCCNIPE